MGFNAYLTGGVSLGLYSMSGVCGNLAVSGSDPYTVTVTQAGNLPYRSGTGTDPESAMCPTDQVIVGFAGRESADLIEALSFKCAPLLITGTNPDYVLSIGSKTDSPTIGDETYVTTFAEIDCPAGQVATTQRPQTGGAVDGFGLACSTVSIDFQ
jgi:hypothetical protein